MSLPHTHTQSVSLFSPTTSIHNRGVEHSPGATIYPQLELQIQFHALGTSNVSPLVNGLARGTATGQGFHSDMYANANAYHAPTVKAPTITLCHSPEPGLSAHTDIATATLAVAAPFVSHQPRALVESTPEASFYFGCVDWCIAAIPSPPR